MVTTGYNPADQWIMCIGFPYITSLWQVGASKEQNGSFNTSMTKGKQILLEKKIWWASMMKVS